MRNQVRRVRPPSQRHRGEVGRIGLHQYPIQRRYGQCGPQLIIRLERDGASKGKVSPTIQTGSGELIIAGEAVHHHPRGPAFGIEHIKNVVMGIAIMDDKGLAEGVGERDVCRKCVPL